MEHGRGSSILWEKGVAQDRNVWIPSTPDKPVLQSSNNDRSEIHHNQIGGENWHDLVDMYEDVLRTKQPHTFDLNSSEGLIYTEHDHEVVPPAENYSMLQQSLTPNGIVDLNSKLQNSQDVDPFEVYSSLPLNLNPNGCAGGNNFGHSIQNVSRLQRLRSLNENAGRSGSYVQSVGEVLPHQEVYSFSELMNIMNSRRSSPSNESPDRRTFFTAKPMISCPVSQIESNQVAYASVGERVQKDHVLHGSNQVAYATVGAGFPQSHVLYKSGGYSQQEILNSRPSMGQYTLNFTSSEARESSSASRSLPLGPVTPDQQKQSSMTHPNSQVPHLLIDGTSTPEKYMHGRVVPSESEVLEKEHGDILENSKSASAFSTSQEIRCSDGGNVGIDPMKTPQQKNPKRTKHRPKVVVEGKPKRSPKPASTKSNTPDGNLPAKRKYIRKEGAKNSTPPITDTVKVVESSDMGPAAKSCKRKLNFDMETGVDKRAEKEGQVSLSDHQEQNHEHQKLSRDSSGLSTTAAKAGCKTTYDKEIRQTPAACNFVHSMNNIPPQELMLLETTALMPSPRDHNLNVIARSFNMRNASTQQSDGKSGYNQVLHRSSGGFPHLVFQGNPREQNLGSEAHSSVWSKPQVLEGLVDVTYKQGTKREYKNSMLGSQQNVERTGFQLQSCGVPEWKTGSETCKKNNIEDKFDGTSFNMYSGLTSAQEFVRQIQSRRSKSVLAQSSTELQMGESRNSDCRRQMINIYPDNNHRNVMYDQYMNNPDIRHKFQQQHASSQVHLYSGRMLAKTYHSSADTQITKSISAVINRNMESAPNRDPQPIAINGYVNFPHHVVVKKQTSGNTSKKVAGISVEKRYIVSVDDVTNRMKDLHITRSGKKLIRKEQGALVPYRGDGAVVPYEEFDIVTKKKPRPRVDLDPETNRLWNLLMGKEGGGSAETMDTHREKWWEEERKIFRGRVDSFIARMHLVQGDRRFSKWKGSVVDSVIGVFLTQNVSDHLSSSAYMSLAAKFPPKSTTASKAHCENGGSPTVGNHDVRITYPDGTTSYQKMVMEPVSGHSSVISTEKSQNRAYNVMPEEKTFDHSRRTAEDIISSQSPSESYVIQASEDVRSSSGSNSESECWWNISKNVGHVSVPKQAERTSALQQNEFLLKQSSYPNNTHLIHHQQFEKSAYMQCSGLGGISKVHNHQSSVRPFTDSWLNMSLGMQNWEPDAVSLSERESLSTLTSKDSKGTGAQCMDGYRGQNAESALRMSEYGRAKSQTPSINFAVSKEGLELKNSSLDESCKTNSQHFVKHMSENQGALDQGMLLKELRRPSEPFSKEPNDNRKHTEVETEVEQGQSSNKVSSSIGTTTSNARKRKKDEQFNWDTLRKQVQLKAGIKERSREAMDSLDYEALQNADVHVVSDTIKERGMNNILAGRMKNFLNRLVEDHERIDLEWLRDVDPDKAKDYLLSIQGLGLKSVECVRLLTLHHLAFPVDTNVGRIAVRLGWVPLQTLPESLQLHLLELYPVLESIQKYLWPRLCKLDQETLYELHYQMITFGKVFCTKRDPNCNACPMRAECRHFASAFASARLALPGPQARHIVSSVAPFRANNRSDVIVKPMPLPPPEETTEQGVRLAKDCEPVIEEPTTPEPPPEVEDRDIEDAFYEDPDEIPVIKLNIEEFTANLQSIIQEQVEIGEGDVSKALVALNPGLASIPTPKLKHVSRLRTEHQVYELPDSHILVKGMDRREPDDPSPYLLAIWTPGETADSVQAPESTCSSMEGGGLCNKTTCFSCNSTREAHAQTVRGTILVPCRTAMRGSFPLNGTYFQVNEVFADHESSLNPIDVPRSFLWNLPRRTVFFGSSVSSIFKGLTTEDIQFCFWKGFVCVRGFDQKTRAPRPLKARLHFPASKMAKRNEET